MQYLYSLSLSLSHIRPFKARETGEKSVLFYLDYLIASHDSHLQDT